MPLVPSEKLQEEKMKPEEIPIELDPERNRRILGVVPSRTSEEVNV